MTPRGAILCLQRPPGGRQPRSPGGDGGRAAGERGYGAAAAGVAENWRGAGRQSSPACSRRGLDTGGSNLWRRRTTAANGALSAKGPQPAYADWVDRRGMLPRRASGGRHPRPSRGSLSASSGRADQPYTGGMEFATARETWRRACVWCNRQNVANRCSSCGAGIKSTCLKILTTNGILQRGECTDHIKHSEGWKYTDLEGATRSLWVGVRYSVLDQDSGSSSTQSVHVSNRDTRPTATCLGLARGGSLWSGGARIGAACGSCHSRPVRGPLTRTLRVKGPARRAARSLCITARAGAARSRRLSVHTDLDSGAARRVHTNGGHHSLPRL